MAGFERPLTDAPVNDVESDKLTDDSTSDDNITIDDNFQGTQLTFGPDGSVISTQTQDDTTDTLTLDGSDDTTDQEGETVAGSSESDTNDLTDDSGSDIQDDITDSSTVTVNTVQPIANGLLVSTSTVGDNFDDFSGDTATDDSTDDNGSSQGGGPAGSSSSSDDTTDDEGDDSTDVINSNGFAILSVTDPMTGMQTNVNSGDVGTDNAGDQASDDDSNDETSGAAGTTDVFNDVADLQAGDSSDDHGPINITVTGSPSAGITVSFGSQLHYDDSTGASVTGSDASTAQGSDAGDLKFDTDEGESDGGTGNMQIGVTVASNDGQGNTTSATDTFTDNGTLGNMADSQDQGEDDFTDANGQATSDAEFDVRHGDAALQTFDGEGMYLRSGLC